MKQSQLTGGYIYSQIRQHEDELKELREALDQVDDRIGRGAAYSLLKDAYDAKQKALNTLKNAKYLPATI